jgi:hypothetical protein
MWNNKNLGQEPKVRICKTGNRPILDLCRRNKTIYLEDQANDGNK